MSEKQNTIQIKVRSTQELFSVYMAVAEELRQRGIMRTSNNLVGDLAVPIIHRMRPACKWKNYAEGSHSARLSTFADVTALQAKATCAANNKPCPDIY